MPFGVVRALLEEEASPRAVLLRQERQVCDVPVVQSHPLLHGGARRRGGASPAGFLHPLSSLLPKLRNPAVTLVVQRQQQQPAAESPSPPRAH